ncbi:MAG: hypothetical protein FWD15_00215 [Alphaproteobacteria bacterium]|nr:hypothetical protein [Alphaproteobacteria bacterium]
MGVFCTITDKTIDRLDAKTFGAVESYLRSAGDASDKDSFDTIKARLANPPVMNGDDFAAEAIYVVLAGGFSQKTAKRLYPLIMKAARKGATGDDLFKIFKNKNKTSAIARIWAGRDDYASGFYAAGDKLEYLAGLPHIGPITANHLARNLGFNEVKYDVHIRRFGMALCGGDAKQDFKAACDKMFSDLERATGLPRGYLDVVLWKACQLKIFNIA